MYQLVELLGLSIFALCFYLFFNSKKVDGQKVYTYSKLTRIIALIGIIVLGLCLGWLLFMFIAFAFFSQ